MYHLPSFSPDPRQKLLAGAPVLRRGSQWWLVSDRGAVLADDPAFAGELDRLAAAMAAADQAVARLHLQQSPDGREPR